MMRLVSSLSSHAERAPRLEWQVRQRVLLALFPRRLCGCQHRCNVRLEERCHDWQHATVGVSTRDGLADHIRQLARARLALSMLMRSSFMLFTTSQAQGLHQALHRRGYAPGLPRQRPLAVRCTIATAIELAVEVHAEILQHLLHRRLLPTECLSRRLEGKIRSKSSVM